jgi:multiple sugar transport system ATP-binding protein
MGIRLEELTKTFPGGVQAVKGVSLTVETGEFAVLLGPSGCGKTTVLRSIAGLETLDHGKIYINDRLVNDLPPKDRNVAMVFQTFTLYPTMDVFSNIAFPLEVHKIPKAEIQRRVNEVAELLGISHLLPRQPSQVSGGERQRVALARIMVREPDAFLMDEPLTALDAKLRVQLRTEIKRLHAKVVRTTIFVTHDQEEAMTLGNKIVVMNQGQVVQTGTPHEVFFRPNSLFVAQFIGSPSIDIIKGRVCSRGDRLVVEAPGFAQPLPDRLAHSVSAKGVEEYVLLGVRPEQIELVDGLTEDAVRGWIEVVEPLGIHQLLHVRIGDGVFRVLSASTDALEAGCECFLHIDPNAVYLFDAETEVSIL